MSPSNSPRQAILLGRLFITPGARAALQRAGTDPVTLLVRHGRGDWGEVCEEDRRLNDRAVVEGGRILSVYSTPQQETVWVITEADRSVTSILLGSEY
jgi:hypothetical protein